MVDRGQLLPGLVLLVKVMQEALVCPQEARHLVVAAVVLVLLVWLAAYPELRVAALVVLVLIGNRLAPFTLVEAAAEVIPHITLPAALAVAGKAALVRVAALVPMVLLTLGVEVEVLVVLAADQAAQVVLGL